MVLASLAAAALLLVAAAPTAGQEKGWLPTLGTHAWTRFGSNAWKEVRIRTSSYDQQGREIRSSTTRARTRVVQVGRRSFSLCVSTTIEVAGQEISPEPQEITRELAPQVESSRVIGKDTVTIGQVEYPTEVVELVTKNGSRLETSRLHHCATTTPQTLRRVTTSVDPGTPESKISTTVSVTELNKMMDILGETQCTWSVTTVIEKLDRTVTIQEVNCRDIPGELVSQLTEERDADGKLLRRKELELVGYGRRRLRGLFRRNR
jgi:hypothetical protein